MSFDVSEDKLVKDADTGFQVADASKIAEFLNGIHARLEVLEAKLEETDPRLSGCWGEDGSRIDALEEKCGATLELMQRLEQLEEQDKHTDRWNDAYHAALGRLAAFAHGPASSELERQATHNQVHEACVMYADHAHGPLETKARPWAEKFNEEYVTHVDALVKTLKHVRHYYTRLPKDCVDMIMAALKPFEAPQ